MYHVSPALNRLAIALLTGAVLASLWVNISPGSYYDFTEWRIFGYDFTEWRIFGATLPAWLVGHRVIVTPAFLVGEGLMALFVALIAKELWEAITLERGALSGRQIIGPMALMAGGVAGASLVWVVLALLFGLRDALPADLGWSAPIGGDVVLCYAFGRMIFGAAHPALKLVLLVSIAETLLALTLAGITAPDHALRPLWLLLPLLAAVVAWWRFGHALRADASLQDHQRGHLVWPYVVAGVASWLGVLAAGLPGALGLLPILPAVAHADRSFGIFAAAEGLLHDPLNRLAHALIWPAAGAVFAFGITYGAVDLSGFATLTLVMLGALWVGKPAGLLAAGVVLARMSPHSPLLQLTRRDIICVAPLMGIAFTAPALGLPWSLPGGLMTEAARLGLALSLIAGPVAVLIARRSP
jgi:Na+:H+ antiporter, NhaA family